MDIITKLPLALSIGTWYQNAAFYLLLILLLGVNIEVLKSKKQFTTR